MFKGLVSGKRWMVLSFVALVAVVVLAGCGGKKEEKPAPAPTPQQSSTPAPAPAPAAAKTDIKIVIPAEPTMLDAQKEDDGNMRLVTNNIYEGLFAMDGKTLKPVPNLATDYKKVDDTHWEFTIRSGVKFHNGDPMKVDDVVFSINRIIDPAYKSNIVGFFAMFDKAEKIDDKTIRITTKGPDPVMLTRLTLLMIMEKKFVEEVKDQIVNKSNGTGPYKLTEWKRGNSLTVSANDNYWGKKPVIKTATYRFIEENATRAAALKTGEVDLATNILPEYVKDLPKVKEVAGLEFSLVRFNGLTGVFKNPDLRMAAALAIDKKALAESLYGGHAKIAPGQAMKPGMFGFSNEIQAYPYDPAKAKELMKKAGYKGEPVQYIYEGGRWLKDQELNETYVAMLQAVGFNVKGKLTQWQDWLAMFFSKDKMPDMTMTFHSNDIFDADRFFSTFIAGKGPATWFPEKYDAQITALQKEMDLAKRQKGYEDLSKQVYNEALVIPTISINDIYAMNPKLNFEPREDGKVLLTDMSFAQ